MKLIWTAAALAAGLTCAPRVDACGGCFHPPPQTSEPSVVTGHRMAFAVSPTRTVLWDQFEYSGSPQDFSWVLPVKPGAYVELSNDGWFEALDSFTTTRIVSPELQCAQADDNGGCGCGSSSDSASAGGGKYAPNNPGVQITHQGSVGPYDTVTLSSTDPQALRAWLTSNGYVVPQNIDPIIDAYVSEGFDFLALRLSPGKGVQQMEPVRVITPGGDYQLPLRMVAAGVGSFVAIKLFVIGEGRFAMPDLPEVNVPLSDLTWDFDANASNYLSLREQTLTKNGGRTYTTTFAQLDAFRSDVSTPNGPVSFTIDPGQGGFAVSTLGELYFAQAAANENKYPACAGALTQLGSSSLVVEGTASGGEIASQSFECEAWSDLAAAMIGMHPDKVWLSRLEMNLPATALDADCVLEPAVSQNPVGNVHEAKKVKNPPCEQPIFTGSSTQALMFGSLFGAWLSRRRLRLRRRLRGNLSGNLRRRLRGNLRGQLRGQRKSPR